MIIPIKAFQCFRDTSLINTVEIIFVTLIVCIRICKRLGSDNAVSEADDAVHASSCYGFHKQRFYLNDMRFIFIPWHSRDSILIRISVKRFKRGHNRMIRAPLTPQYITPNEPGRTLHDTL